MELHTAALFHHDDAGRITGTNDGEPPGIAPRLYLGRTREGDVWRFRNDLPDDLVAELTNILETKPTTIDLWQPPVALPRLQNILTKYGCEENAHMGPAVRFPTRLPESTDVVVLDVANIETV